MGKKKKETKEELLDKAVKILDAVDYKYGDTVRDLSAGGGVDLDEAKKRLKESVKGLEKKIDELIDLVNELRFLGENTLGVFDYDID